MFLELLICQPFASGLITAIRVTKIETSEVLVNMTHTLEQSGIKISPAFPLCQISLHKRNVNFSFRGHWICQHSGEPSEIEAMC